jgi:phosphatidylinositol alpha-1,6-mannosyltransferase
MSTAPSHAVLLTTDFRPMPGGIASFLHGLWDHVADVMPATVISTVPDSGAAWPHRYRLTILEAVADPTLSPPQRLLTMRGQGVPTTLAQLRPIRADALVLVGVWNVLAHAWCRGLVRAGIPYGLLAHDSELADPVLYQSVEGWQREDVADARFLFANSRDTAVRLRARFGDDLCLRVLHPGVYEPPHLESLNPRIDGLRRELGLSGGPVLLTVARLEPSKGVDLVIDSLGDLVRSFPGLRYLVAGAGPERASLERRAGELGVAASVRFLGSVDESTKQALLALCDVFVMPSRLVSGRPWEGFGISYLEAAAAGRPAVGGRVGGTGDAIVDGVTGLLVDSTGPRPTFNALSRLLTDAELRTRLGQAGRERVQRQFLWPSVAAGFLREAGLSL